MSNSDTQFSSYVERYFRHTGTYPATLMFKNEQVNTQFLQQLEQAITQRFENIDGIRVLDITSVEGDYWGGVLVEFSDSEVPGVEDVNLFDKNPEKQSLFLHLREIYEEFDEYDQKLTGVSIGTSVYPVAALEHLGQDFFMP